MLTLLQGYLANFVRTEIITSCENVMEIDYHDRAHQVANKYISIGTASRIFLAEHKDEVKGTAVERRFFSHVRVFYETVVEKMIAKFP